MTLTYAAALTQRVKLGSTVIVVPYRNPLVVAKMLATLDVLSQGRVIFGAGAGGAPDEFQALGVPSHQRGTRTDAYLRLMVALWTQDPTNFKGRFFSFRDVRFQPKPRQKPHPPLWVGGRSEMVQLRHLAHESGRAKGPGVTVHQSVQLSTGHTPATGEARRLGQGTPQQIREDLSHYQELGIPVVVCNFAAPNFEELGRAMEIFAIQVMASFPEPA